MIRWHEVKRKLGIRWKKRWFRVLTTIFTLIAATVIVFALSKLPQAVDVEKKKYSPAKSQAGQQEIVLHDPVRNSDGSLFFYQGKPNETIELYANKARLSDDTFEFYLMLTEGGPVPKGDSKISYTVREIETSSGPESRIPAVKEPSAGRTPQACLAYIGVSLLDPTKSPSEIHFYEPPTGSAYSRPLEIWAKDADLQIFLAQSQPNDGSLPPGCGKILLVRDWKLPIDGRVDVNFIVPAGWSFQIIFRSVDPKMSLATDKEEFEPFRFRDRPLQASALIIKQNKAAAPPSPPDLEVSAPKGRDPLSVNNLKAARNGLEVSFSGVGLVRSSGELVSTFSLFDFIAGNLIGAAILTALIGGFSAWVIHSVRKK